jgi:hypothetical protein
MLLIIFLGATLWAWLTGATEECGCYGAFLKYTPGEAVIENLILLAATALGWVSRPDARAPQTRVKSWALVIACLAGLVLPVAFGFPISGLYRPQSGAEGLELGQLEIEGVKNIDIRQGTYLIVLLDTECEHCQDDLPKLDMLAEHRDLPNVVALCRNEEIQRMRFLETFQPRFPLGRIQEDVFFRLLGLGDVPITLLVRDRQVLKRWDQKIPDQTVIKEAMAG